MQSVDEIKIGDWVTCYYSGYWQVIDIKHNYVSSEISDLLVIVKKGFTQKMKFNVSLKYCDIRWCKKTDDDKLVEIVNYFNENPRKKQEFDTYNGPLYGITKGWLIDLTEEEVKIYSDKLRALPKYFSISKFNRFVEEIGLRKYMFQSSNKAKYMLTIVTYPWLIDERKNHSPLYFLEKGIYLKPKIKEYQRISTN